VSTGSGANPDYELQIREFITALRHHRDELPAAVGCERLDAVDVVEVVRRAISANVNFSEPSMH